MIKKKKKICSGTYKVNYFHGCGEDKFIHKFGLCNSCFMSWCFSTTEGQEYYKNQFIPAGKMKVQIEEKKERKESVKKKGEYERELQTIVNRIVRIIDTGKGCISCNHGWQSKWTRQQHAGHRLSVGSCPELRFNFNNIYLQCSICNNWKSGNEREYDKGLLNHYDNETLEKVQNLRIIYPSLSITIPELKEAIKTAKIIEKEILSGQSFTRDELNTKLGIYGNH